MNFTFILVASFLLIICYFLNSQMFGLFFADIEAELWVAYFLIFYGFW